jgi:uncharacterized protein YxeA
MKKTVLAMLILVVFTAFAAAQEKHDVTQRQQPVITQEKVERDAKQAQEERKKAEGEHKAQLEKQKREQHVQVKVNTTNGTAITTKKTSTSTGEQ